MFVSRVGLWRKILLIEGASLVSMMLV